MLDNELLQMIAASPKAFLRRNYRTEERIKIKCRRRERLWEAGTAITQAPKAVVAYTGPGDKTGDTAIELTALQEEIEEEIAALARIQRETAEAIRLLVPDSNLRDIIEAYYLTGMRWEEVACTLHYSYRWTMRLHRSALKTMRVEAQKLIGPVQNDKPS